MKKNHQHSPWVQPARLVVQLAFLAFATFAAWRHQVLGGGPDGSAPVDALCPFGGLEALFKFVSSGEFIQRLNTSDFVLLAGTIVLALTLGRYFCGWICPLGTLQELARKLGQKLFRKVRITLPARIDSPLRWLKYVVLVWALVFTWKTGTLIIRPYDPWAAYAHGFAGWSEVWAEFSAGVSILLGSLIIGLFIDRVFCKYLCPLGAFLGLTAKLGLFSIKRNGEGCLVCNKCEKTCPVNIPIMAMHAVRSAECIGCLTCTTTCPTGKKGTADEGRTFLLPAIAGRQIRPAMVGWAGLAIFIGMIGSAQLTGYWRTQPASIVAAVTSAGQLDAQAIRGYMTLEDVSKSYGFELDKLYRELGISEQKVPATSKCKEIGKLLGLSESEFDTQKVRDAVVRLQNKGK
ncbi:4Fe-4S binding protein [Uliginosibacterium sp. 31-16]|uniref:4Fe-4S binding protein n=1 Tax=Uliginosibacterium sp. 31-16 TaxID=3068315 RepID=UPI00273E1A15|nr:4Fe-4S binding protein [Uliginosibacterium sp. 31-16]MDP5240183.1 4Fe-4S binding protein [Uliginosibacterium sp. 31-16]